MKTLALKGVLLEKTASEIAVSKEFLLDKSINQLKSQIILQYQLLTVLVINVFKFIFEMIPIVLIS